MSEKLYCNDTFISFMWVLGSCLTRHFSETFLWINGKVFLVDIKLLQLTIEMERAGERVVGNEWFFSNPSENWGSRTNNRNSQEWQAPVGRNRNLAFTYIGQTQTGWIISPNTKLDHFSKLSNKTKTTKYWLINQRINVSPY